ncbi:MAG: sulfite exporter TauE/SafE family protein [Chthoniobacteraceae bacterium]
MPELTAVQWLLAIVAAMGIGVAKSGFAGVSLVHVLVFAFLFGARDSTGVVLPLLIVGDICALLAFHQHARWDYVRRMLPPACIGVIGGWAFMQRIDAAAFKPLIGWIILVLTALQVARMRRPEWFAHIPHSRWFAWTVGLLAGFTTMLANAAGPIMALYFLAVALPKLEFVGTSAWYFFIVNSFKVPFSAGLGLIRSDTLLLNAMLIPAVALGLVAGRWLVKRVPQRLFDGLLLGFAAIAALRLVGLF